MERIDEDLDLHAKKKKLRGREEVLDLGVKVVSISGAKGKKIIDMQKWKSRPYRQARTERSAMESLLFALERALNSER